MAKNNPRVVDFMITGICNLSCPFCYGPDPRDRSELTAIQIESLITFLCMRNVQGVVIAGGEPTLSANLTHTLRALKHNNMWTALQTNGTRPAVILPYLQSLAWLALPLDSVSPEGQLSLRTSRSHLKAILHFVNRPEVGMARSTGMRLKIGTVLTPQNYLELPAIAEIVERISPDVWKIYQLRPRGAGYVNRGWLSLENATFLASTAETIAMHPTLNIVASPATKSPGAYLIINPDSTLLVPLMDRYHSYGRLLINDSEVDENVWWSALREVDQQALELNVRHSFPDNNPYKSSAVGGSAVEAQASHIIAPKDWWDRDGH